jgi:ribosome-associated protein YbcJ (S4-like RNA binding protein)
MKKSSARSLKIGDRPINLTQVLKLAGCAQSGGELRKRRKLKAGDIVLFDDGSTVELST